MRIKVDGRGAPDGQVVLAKKYHLKSKIVEVFFFCFCRGLDFKD
jgi:hypothetical protein